MFVFAYFADENRMNNASAANVVKAASKGIASRSGNAKVEYWLQLIKTYVSKQLKICNQPS